MSRIILQVCSISIDHELTVTHEVTRNDDLCFLLTEFYDIFETPIGLPPSRSKTIGFLFKLGIGPVCILPYQLLVQKHDGSWRFCMDYSALNRQVVKDKFPTSDQWTIRRVAWCKVDLIASYFQICMDPINIHKMTFRTHHRHFEFLVMSLGLSNTYSTF